MLISRTNCRISVGTAGRPKRRLDFKRQNNRKPARCQRTTVSGRTMASASWAFGNRRQAQLRTNLSTAKNGIRFGLPRRKTMICCLSTRTSASSAARDRNRSTTKPKISLQRSHINAGSSDFPPIANRTRFTTGTGMAYTCQAPNCCTVTPSSALYPQTYSRIGVVFQREQARWQFYDLSAPEDPAFGSIAAMMADWTFSSCAVTAAVSDNRRCRVS